jgi:hypothetical protein
MCHTTLKNPNLLERHKSTCKMYKVRKNKGKDVEDVTIVTVDRKLWQPKDFNLK